MKKVILGLMFAGGLMWTACGSGSDAPTTKASEPEAPKAPAPTSAVFTVDAGQSSLGWRGWKAAYDHKGTVMIQSGELSVEGANITGGNFVVDMSTIIENGDGTFGDATKAQELAGHLKSEDFFDATKFPNSKFEITEVMAKAGEGGTTHMVKGNMTIKATTKNISFPATIQVQGDKVMAKANFKVNRADFDVRYGSGTFFDNLGDKVISDDIEFDVNLIANKGTAS